MYSELDGGDAKSVGQVEATAVQNQSLLVHTSYIHRKQRSATFILHMEPWNNYRDAGLKYTKVLAMVETRVLHREALCPL